MTTYRKYHLTATGGERTRTHTWESTDPEHATLDATFIVMDRAFRDPLWARGRIELTDDDGTVINVMEAKD